MVHRVGHQCGEHLGDPEGVPHTVRAKAAAQHCGQRHDEHHIAAQRDHQRRHALAKALQCAGRGGGHCRHHKADADDAQGLGTGGDGIGVGGEQPDELPGGQQADDRAQRHDGDAHKQGELVQLLHAGVLPGTVVVADERAHTLYDAVGGQVQKGLQLVVNAQNDHIALGEPGKQAVEEGDQQGGQSQVQDGRHADGVQLAVQCNVRVQAAAAQPHRQFGAQVDEQVHAQAQQLADAGGQRCTGNAHGGHRAQAEDQDGVQQDVAHAAEHQRHHGHLHAAHSLEHLFKGQRGHIDGGKQEHDGGVGDAGGHKALVGGEPAQKARHDCNAHHRDDHAVQQAEHHAVGGGDLGLFAVARTQVQGDHGVDADTKADGDGVGKVLDGVYQREGGHGVLADLRHKQAVHDVVQGVDQHGDHVGQRHGQQQRQHGAFFHKGIVH